MPAYSSSDAQRPPAYVMSRIGSHGVDDRRGIIRFRDEPLTNNGQAKLFQRVFENWSVLENCVRYFIFRDIQKKKEEEKEKRGVLSLSTHLYICSHRNR